MGATPAWLASLEAMMNRELWQSPRATALAKALEGRSLCVAAGGIITVRAAISAGRLALTTDEADADARIDGPPLALLALFREATGSPASSSSVQIRGDADTANRFRTLFKCLRPDFQGQAARLIGEIPARELARLGVAMAGWARDALDTGRRNIAEYLVEESRDLVNRTEVEEFLRGVDRTREQCDRVEARLALLERRSGATH